MVPVTVGWQHAKEPAAVVAAGVKLLAHRSGGMVRSALETGEGRDVCVDIGPEAGVDKKVAFGVLHQDRRCGEVPFVAERPTADGEGRSGLVRAGRQLVDRHVRGWDGGGKGLRPRGGHRERFHVPIIRRKNILFKNI
jgi:hypothetical protein